MNIIKLVCFSSRYSCFSINWHSRPTDTESYLLHPCHKQCHKVVCQPKPNKFKVPKNLMLSKLNWIVQMVKVANISMPKTIIFCDTIYALAQVVNYVTMELGECAFYPSLRIQPVLYLQAI